jgi:uncharacterized protein
MMEVTDTAQGPWPWYIAGPLIGLLVPLLLILGNKAFGVSSSLRHICAACIPANIPFFKYDWKKESWNLFFVSGIIVGAFIATTTIGNTSPGAIAPSLENELSQYGVTYDDRFLPSAVFNFSNIFTIEGFIIMIVGGFLVGFGTRYAGGCTSGHSIMGMSALQLPSLIATICFMIGGFFAANVILPFILSL